MPWRWLACLLIFGSLATAAAAADRPQMIRWDFGAEETTPLRSHGGVHRDVPGPRPPEYPDFEPGNTAVRFDGRGARLSFDDPGPESLFDFTNGDALTLEAWVQLDEIRPGENVYVVGKGRTGSPGFAPDNQNWALRVREVKGQVCLSFLFATPRAGGVPRSDSHWHRWTSTTGFRPGKRWHHIAVAYRFGEPESIRGWIDGRPQTGRWDMGGETREAPVVDDDAIWIGSSNGASAGNSFRGVIDAVAVHRQALDDATMKSRYRREGPDDEPLPQPAVAAMPDLGPLPPGQVVAMFHEPAPAHDRWLFEDETLPAEAARCELDVFLLNRLPVHYDAWGLRDSWKIPLVMRLAADVQLEPGRRRFLLRARGLSRLWVDGQLVAATRPLTGGPNGEEEITPVAAPPAPGQRRAEHRQQEVFGEALAPADGRCRVVLETIVGGKSFRPAPGEVCVAVETSDGRGFELLEAARSTPLRIPLTDAAVVAELDRIEQRLDRFDTERRRAAAASQDDFWNRRHAAARQWAEQNPPPQPPQSPTAGTAGHPIDAFLQAKINVALAQASSSPAVEAERFHSRVLPILRSQCFRCHGEKDNGGLRLNSREAVLRGGDSELPAVTPGKLDESELIRRIRSHDPDERMPPGGQPLDAEQVAILEAWVTSGAPWPAPPLTPEAAAPPPVVGDAAFLRRVYFDVIGLPPTEGELREFLADVRPDKRAHIVDRLLSDDRWADHWVSYWQDVLAENPTLINASLNTTGPFRWFLYDALRDNKPLDRMAAELIQMRGGAHEGGPAGFALAGDNDSPLAAKAQIIAGAFLGVELQCARCHDSPYHSTTQADLYSLAAMLDRKPLTAPKSSRVPAAFFESKARESLIKVTLDPNQAVAPKWPFAAATGASDDAALQPLLTEPADSRERLAALVTAPQNQRFAQVLVNRLWRRYLGAGLVEPVNDWEGRTPSHPELLRWLAHELVSHGYDLKHVARWILTSQTYQRAAVGDNLAQSPETRYFLAPDRRRLTAEQIVDALYYVSGQRMDVEELTFDPDGRRLASNRLSLGVPRRSWMLANLANERDRPSLNLPRAGAVVDMLSAFGWTGARQSPLNDRETSPSVQQPGILENGVASVWLATAAEESALAQLAVESPSPSDLVDSLFLRYLGRFPAAAERAPLQSTLAEGFEQRLLPVDEIQPRPELTPLPRITWYNHLNPEANAIALQYEQRARLAPLPDPRLRPQWRELYEDVVWSVFNLAEFVWSP